MVAISGHFEYHYTKLWPWPFRVKTLFSVNSLTPKTYILRYYTCFCDQRLISYNFPPSSTLDIFQDGHIHTFLKLFLWHHFYQTDIYFLHIYQVNFCLCKKIDQLNLPHKHCGMGTFFTFCNWSFTIQIISLCTFKQSYVSVM